MTDVLDNNPAMVRNKMIFDEALHVCEEDWRAHHDGAHVDTHENLLRRILIALRHPHNPSRMLHIRHTAGKNPAA